MNIAETKPAASFLQLAKRQQQLQAEIDTVLDHGHHLPNPHTETVLQVLERLAGYAEGNDSNESEPNVKESVSQNTRRQ